MTATTRVAFVFIFILAFGVLRTSAQRFLYGATVGYSTVKYYFPVENDRYYTSDIEPFQAIKFGGFVQYEITSSFRMGTGLQYISIKGKNDGGSISGRFVNPNGNGNLTFDVKNSFLIFSVEFQLMLSNAKIKPALSGGLNFFKALQQSMLIHIEPEDPDPSYEDVQTEIDKGTPSSYFGARIGAGVVYSAFENQELSLMIHRNFYKSRYEKSDPIMGIFEKHEITFNLWEISLGWMLK